VPMKIINITLICLLISCTAHAASLTELQQTALDNRKVIDRYQANLEKSGQAVKSARSRYLPSLDVSYAATQLDEASPFEYRENSTASGIVSINLFAGFKDKYTIESAQLLQKAESYRLNSIRQDIMLNVALRYLSIFDKRANLQVTQDFHNTIAKAYEDAKSRFEVGLIQKSDLLKFKVDLDNAVIGLKKAQVEEKKSIRLLQREIGADIQAEQLNFKEFAHLPSLVGQEQYRSDMLDNRSEIKILTELIQAAEAQVKVAYANHYPTVDLSSGYHSTDDSLISNSSGVNEEEFRTSLVLTMNIFDGYDTNAQVNIAKLEAQAIEYDLEELKDDLNSELDNLFLDYGVSVDNVAVAESSIVQAEENLRVNKLSYQEGVTTESDLLDAIANLSRARYNFVTAKSELFSNYFRITREAEKF
jgi:outer membrane protein TolC